MNENIHLDKKILERFIKKFWFAPSDALLRAVETCIWKTLSFSPKTLAIGIGDGRYDQLLFGRMLLFDWGIDNDCQAILKAQKYKLYKKVACQSAEKMSFPNNMFETVVSNSTLEHIQDDLKAVSEVSRVLKNNGLFIFSVPTPRLIKQLRKVQGNNKKTGWFNNRVCHFHYRSLSEWSEILLKNNLKIIKHTHYFDKKSFKVWWNLFKISTFRPYKRELWSYLKDSPYGKLAPKKIIITLLIKYLTKYFKDAVDDQGVWLFIVAQKIK